MPYLRYRGGLPEIPRIDLSRELFIYPTADIISDLILPC